MTVELFFKNQNYILYLMSVMIITGIIKDKNIFSNFYSAIVYRIKSKRILLMIISAFSGILPIPGRVVISAGVLSTIPNRSNQNDWKLGILDYLSTHHYYLWSPLEKSVIILMSALGLSYVQVLTYTFPLLVISLGILLFYNFKMIKEDDILIDVPTRIYELKSFYRYIIPLLISIGLIIFYPPWVIFPISMIYYLIISSTWNIKKIVSYVNFKLVALLINVIIVGNFAKFYTNELTDMVQHFSSFYSIETMSGLFIISSISFGISFLMGSSSRYTGIVALLASVYGIQYLTYFIALEFSAYLLSPMHKCLSIGKMYFNTPLLEYYKVILIWAGLMISYALFQITVFF